MHNDLFNKKIRLETLRNGMGMKYILNTACEILGNPIALFDINYNLLEYAEDVITDDPLWFEFTTCGELSPETMISLKAESVIDNVTDSEILYLFKNDKLKYAGINGEIFDRNNVKLANIIVLSCYKPFTKDDPGLIISICKVISDEFCQNEFHQSQKQIYQESILSNLLCGVEDKGAITIDSADFCNAVNSRFYLAVMDTSQYVAVFAILKDFNDMMIRLLGEFRYCIYSKYIIFIVKVNSPMSALEGDLSELYEFFFTKNIYAEIVGPFEDLLDLPRYYFNAVNIMNFSAKSLSDSVLFH